MAITPSATPNPSLLGQQAPSLRLAVEHNGNIQSIVLTESKITLGCEPTCTVHIPAEGHPVHCLILRGPQQVVCRSWAPDTWLNGEAFSDAPLNPGDEITFAGATIRVLADDTEEPFTRNSGDSPDIRSRLDEIDMERARLEAQVAALQSASRELPTAQAPASESVESVFSPNNEFAANEVESDDVSKFAAENSNDATVMQFDEPFESGHEPDTDDPNWVEASATDAQPWDQESDVGANHQFPTYEQSGGHDNHDAFPEEQDGGHPKLDAYQSNSNDESTYDESANAHYESNADDANWNNEYEGSTWSETPADEEEAWPEATESNDQWSNQEQSQEDWESDSESDFIAPEWQPEASNGIGPREVQLGDNLSNSGQDNGANSEDPFERLQENLERAASDSGGASSADHGDSGEYATGNESYFAEETAPHQDYSPTSEEDLAFSEPTEASPVDAASILSKLGHATDVLPEEPTGPLPKPHMEQSAVETHQPASPVDDDEASIQDYMQQLLARSGGTDSAQAAESQVATNQSLETQVEQAPAPDVEMTPLTSLPPAKKHAERATDLAAMRALANESTRTAITRHEKRSKSKFAKMKLLSSIAMVLGAAILVTLSQLETNMFLLGGLLLFGLALVTGLQGVSSGLMSSLMRVPKNGTMAKKKKRRRRRRN